VECGQRTRAGGSPMQSLRVILIGVVASAAIPVLAGSAYAHSGIGRAAGTTAACVVACNMEKKGCISTARVAALACKQDCRQNAAQGQLGACMQACMTTFRSSKDTCRSDQRTCIGGCVPPTAGGGDLTAATSCFGTCGADLAECVQGVVTTARTCVGDCRTASDRLTCLEGCATGAQTGAETCASDFQTCGSSCSP
jgi:hypothetical protein